MIKRLHIRNFKSWRDTGPIRMAPITGFLGANSSGKTAILQLLLLLKQTVEATDRARVLYFGDDRAYVDLGAFPDVVHAHQVPGEIDFMLDWSLPSRLRVADPEERPNHWLIDADDLAFAAKIVGDLSGVSTNEFTYQLANRDGAPRRFGMRRSEGENGDRTKDYELIAAGYTPKRTPGRPWPLPAPVKFYGFPDQVSGYYQNMGFASMFALALEEAFARTYYLGPLREYPHRSYVWAGDQPEDVGRRGELAIPALLAARERNLMIGRGRGRKRQHVDERVAEWLRELGLIHSFELAPIAPNRKEYEVRVRRTRSSAKVLITDVGFGVSQILPVLTLCYYAPEGATLLFEQPEIHLHPSVQAGLADVLIDASRTRNVQIILESHSEHLLRRLQRRIAEEQIDADETALYFVEMPGTESKLRALDVDTLGNIRNWPENFFGDELGDLIAMSDAAERRQRQANGANA